MQLREIGGDILHTELEERESYFEVIREHERQASKGTNERKRSRGEC